MSESVSKRDISVYFSLSLDPNVALSLQTQLFEQVRELILSGVLKGGVALPPSRHLALHYRILRNTISLA